MYYLSDFTNLWRINVKLFAISFLYRCIEVVAFIAFVMYKCWDLFWWLQFRHFIRWNSSYDIYMTPWRLLMLCIGCDGMHRQGLPAGCNRLPPEEGASNFFYELIHWALPVKLVLGEWHSTPLIIGQHWFRKWLGAVNQESITWASVDPDLWRHYAAMGLSSDHCFLLAQKQVILFRLL